VTDRLLNNDVGVAKVIYGAAANNITPEVTEMRNNTLKM
jgi:hypothetical protein